MNGWGKMFRKISDYGFLKNGAICQLYSWIICNASFKDDIVEFNGYKIPVKEGQVPFGRNLIAKELGLSEKNIRVALENLVKYGFVSITKSNKYSIITVENPDNADETAGANLGANLGANPPPPLGANHPVTANVERTQAGENSKNEKGQPNPSQRANLGANLGANPPIVSSYIRIKNEEEASNDASCAEPSADAEAPRRKAGKKPRSKAVKKEEQTIVPINFVPKVRTAFSLPLIDGTIYYITPDDLALWKDSYPAVDVEQELRSMRAWCDANPTNRKTRGGIKRFINSWLRREQNCARVAKTKPPRADTEWQYQMQERRTMAQEYLNAALNNEQNNFDYSEIEANEILNNQP